MKIDNQKAIEVLEAFTHGVGDKEGKLAFNLAIRALEKQVSFESEVSNIHEWFVNNKSSLLDVAMKVAKDSLKHTENVAFIDEVDLDFIVEDIVDEIQKGILNVLSTYMG